MYLAFYALPQPCAPFLEDHELYPVFLCTFQPTPAFYALPQSCAPFAEDLEPYPASTPAMFLILNLLCSSTATVLLH